MSFTHFEHAQSVEQGWVFRVAHTQKWAALGGENWANKSDHCQFSGHQHWLQKGQKHCLVKCKIDTTPSYNPSICLSQKSTKSVHLMLLCSYFLGIWLETPATSLSPVILNLIRWLDAVNIPFSWICICLLISCMFCCQRNAYY